jgi:hypothetical protein
MMNNDVLVAIGASDVDDYLHLAKRAIGSIELDVKTSPRGLPEERAMVQIGRGDFDESKAGRENDLVIEKNGAEERQTVGIDHLKLHRVGSCPGSMPHQRLRRFYVGMGRAALISYEARMTVSDQTVTDFDKAAGQTGAFRA